MLLLLLLLGAATSRCLHDETQKSVSLLRPSFSQLPPNFRSSSLTLPGSLDPQPLRIQICYIGDPVSDGAWDPEGDGMRGRSRALAAVREAAQRLQGVLAVPPVRGPLLLSRDPAQYCHGVWGDPDTPNYRRKISSVLPLFPPFRPHLVLAHPQPSIIAYAACCQLDSEDRPLAGTIVYCAQHLTSPSLSHSDIVMATLHELLHALGFSGQLFKKWRDCPSGPSVFLSSYCLLSLLESVRENCSTRQQVTRRDEWGQLLLTTPTVSHSLAKHLGVLGVSLGVPLEEEGSVMTATFDGAQRTRLDPITLAAFEDSGWYQVNHSAAEELLWGQAGSGLEFGLVSTCGTGSSDFFCTGSGPGCHYLHLDKGSCSSDPTLEGCRMFKPLANGVSRLENRACN
ncbi:hypothetical protein HPG69_002166 [Diceros bicornis minor]|uniref:Leishmanolysin-like peptidase n=1 Tax=Diceros bicornis minor TaxID=77932 RepID=A0A7J7FDE6_DICBM|nr:hypothetical protein HPG69_002166 [Diceros bicornis minor]